MDESNAAIAVGTDGSRKVMALLSTLYVDNALLAGGNKMLFNNTLKES